jgi:hypothetical protein
MCSPGLLAAAMIGGQFEQVRQTNKMLQQQADSVKTNIEIGRQAAVEEARQTSEAAALKKFQRRRQFLRETGTLSALQAASGITGTQVAREETLAGLNLGMDLGIMDENLANRLTTIQQGQQYREMQGQRQLDIISSQTRDFGILDITTAGLEGYTMGMKLQRAGMGNEIENLLL